MLSSPSTICSAECRLISASYVLPVLVPTWQSSCRKEGALLGGLSELLCAKCLVQIWQIGRGPDFCSWWPETRLASMSRLCKLLPSEQLRSCVSMARCIRCLEWRSLNGLCANICSRNWLSSIFRSFALYSSSLGCLVTAVLLPLLWSCRETGPSVLPCPAGCSDASFP